MISLTVTTISYKVKTIFKEKRQYFFSGKNVKFCAKKFTQKIEEIPKIISLFVRNIFSILLNSFLQSKIQNSTENDIYYKIE